MSSTLKKVDYIFEEPVNLQINVDEFFFSSAVDSRRK